MHTYNPLRVNKLPNIKKSNQNLAEFFEKKYITIAVF
jgi:hypothetical protein